MVSKFPEISQINLLTEPIFKVWLRHNTKLWFGSILTNLEVLWLVHTIPAPADLQQYTVWHYMQTEIKYLRGNARGNQRMRVMYKDFHLFTRVPDGPSSCDLQCIRTAVQGTPATHCSCQVKPLSFLPTWGSKNKGLSNSQCVSYIPNALKSWYTISVENTGPYFLHQLLYDIPLIHLL